MPNALQKTGESPKMPRREYYDRGAPCPDDKLVPASREKQEAYRYLRSRFTQALTKNLQEIKDTVPEVAAAANDLNKFLKDNPHTPFGIFRPEDIDFTDQAGSPVFLR